MDFVAIDFETANEQRHSACEIGLCVVRNGQVVESRAWLIRPPELRFNSFNTYLHGIAAQHVRNEPEFDGLWPALQPYLEGRLVLAHNAGFDLSVLRSLLTRYALPYPHLRYACSLALARRVWRGQPSYRLNALAATLDIPLDHHRALSDAVACAHLAIRAFRQYEVQSTGEMEEKLGLKAGWLFEGGYVPCSSVRWPTGNRRVKRNQIYP